MDSKEKTNRLTEPQATQEQKKRAYASEITDTLGHKLGKNQIANYEQQTLFTEDINGQYVYITDNGNTTITADTENESPLKPVVSVPTEKVLKIILTKLNENFSGTNHVYLKDITADELRRKTIIAIPLNEYMDSVGITDKKTARDNLKKASTELYNKSIKHTFNITQKTTTTTGKQKTKRDKLTLEFRLLDAKAEFKNGNVIFFLSQRATPYLTESTDEYNPLLLKTDIQQYPHAFTIGEYLNRQYNRTKGGNNHGRISIIKVLENCEIPNIEQVEHRKYKEKIKSPLLDSLDYLKDLGIITNYYFYDKQGTIYTKYESLELPIKKFVGLLLYYEMPNN